MPSLASRTLPLQPDAVAPDGTAVRLLNALEGVMPLADWARLGQADVRVVDVREPHEFDAGHLDGAVNLPLSVLRDRVDEVPRDREVWLVCAAGQRAYFAQRLLRQRGVDAKVLPGGWQTYTAMRDAGLVGDHPQAARSSA